MIDQDCLFANASAVHMFTEDTEGHGLPVLKRMKANRRTNELTHVGSPYLVLLIKSSTAPQHITRGRRNNNTFFESVQG